MEILRRRYRVFTLKDWLVSVLTVPSTDTQCYLVEEDDNLSYVSLLTDVYVCEERSVNQHVKLQKSEASRQKEVVIKAIENILKKHGFGKNVLSDGFCLLSTDRFAQQCGANVESRYPNSCVNRLYYSVWDTLLSRIGDTAMMYMLENMSLFYKISDTCFVQLTGLSVNNVADNIDITDEVITETDGKDSKHNAAADLGANTDIHKVNVSDIHKENVADIHKENVADIHRENLADIHRENVADIHKENVADIHRENVADIHKEHMSDIYKENIADIHEENVGELDGPIRCGRSDVVCVNISETNSVDINQGEYVGGSQANETRTDKGLHKGFDKHSRSAVANTKTNLSISSVVHTEINNSLSCVANTEINNSTSCVANTEINNSTSCVANTETKLSTSSVANTKTNISTKQKWKRKYEQVSDTRFQLLRDASEMYAKTIRLQVDGNITESLMPDQSKVTVAEFVCSQLPGSSRKRKNSEVINVEKPHIISVKVLTGEKLPEISKKIKSSSAIQNDEKQSIMSKKRKGCDILNDEKLPGRKGSDILTDEKQPGTSLKGKSSDILNDEKQPGHSKKRKRSEIQNDEMTDTYRNEHATKRRKVGEQMKDSGNVPVLEVKVKTAECRRTNKKVVCKDQVPRNKKTGSKCPMLSYHLALLRGSVLFTRNPRATFLKSATLSPISPSPEGILSLYKDIFYESEINTERCCINVKIPELDDVKTLLCNPTDLLACQTTGNPPELLVGQPSVNPSELLAGQASVAGVKQKLTSHFSDHPSFCSNDSMFLSSGVLYNKAHGSGYISSPNSRLGRYTQNTGKQVNKKLIVEPAKCENAMRHNLQSEKISLCLKSVSDLKMKIKHETLCVKHDTNTCLSSAKHDTSSCLSSVKHDTSSCLSSAKHETNSCLLSAKQDTKICLSSGKHDTKSSLSSAQQEEKSVQLTCQQIDKLLNETTSDNDSIAPNLNGKNSKDKSLSSINEPNVKLKQLVVRNSVELHGVTELKDHSNRTCVIGRKETLTDGLGLRASRELPGITAENDHTHSNKKCAIKGKETVSSRDDFGFVLVTNNKPVCVDPVVTLPHDKHVSRCTLSTKEKLLAKRNKQLLADKNHNDGNDHMNVFNVSHESDTSMNASHSSRKSTGITQSQALYDSDTMFQSSDESTNNSKRQGSVDVDGSGTDNTLHINVPVLNHVMPLLKEFIEKHRSCPYVRFLNKHCPAVRRGFKKTNKPAKIKGFGRRYTAPSVSRLLSEHIHNRKVYMFLRLCVLHVLPDGLLGGRHNRNVIMKNISRIISLGRHEKVTIGQLVSGMRTKEVPWLNEVKSNNIRIYLLACIIYWWYSNYVFLILRTFFYVTDTSFLRYKLLYYRQSTWNQLHILGIKGLMKRGILRPISEKYGFEMLESRRSLGVSSLRFLPKPKSLRPIMNMGRSVQVTRTQGLSVNKQLASLHSVLTYMKNKKPSLISHGKLGMDEIYRSWKEYVNYWRSVESPELYFVKTDIANCYDSIDQRKLCSIIENLIHTEMLEEEYIIRKYFSLRMTSGSVRKRFHRVVAPISEFHPDFISYCKHLVNTNNLKNVIFVDAVVYQHETHATLIPLLRSLLLNNVIKVGSQYYIQGAGISQGSVLSTLLCNLYYSSMEREHLHIEDGEILMRIVDDYLFVTPYRQHAETFLNKMLYGVPDYNCVTNMQKVLMNFDYKFDGESLPAIKTGWFPWCGVLINTKSLEVALDSSRNTGFNMRDTLTMELSKHPGKSLKEKMTMCVSKKYHDVYVDPCINTEQQILTNIYQIFTVTACKFHTAIRQLPFKERAEKNTNYYLGIIKEVSGVTVFLVNRLLHMTDSKIEDLASKIKWLCLQACHKVLRRYHSQYSKLLKLVEKNMKQIQRRIGRPICIDIHA